MVTISPDARLEDYSYYCPQSPKSELTCTCSICSQEVPGVIIIRIYSNKGIPVCLECHNKIQQYSSKPYSKLMDQVALLEEGYYVNRKQARCRSQGYYRH
jgi:hypothetical protein